MAALVLTNAYVSINGVNLSDHITSITLNTTEDVIDTTAFGNTARTRVAGLLDNSVVIEFQQDYATSNVEATIYPLVGSTTALIVNPNSSTTSATNPRYSFTALVSEWQPLNGAVGELATASVTWPISGTITKATS
jgi:hypothetical protein